MHTPVQWTEQWLAQAAHVSESLAAVGSWVVVILGLVLLMLAAYGLLSGLVVRIIMAFVRRTKTKWDDALMERRLFRRLSHLGPALLLFFCAKLLPPIDALTERIAVVYLLIIGLLALLSAIDAGIDIYQTYPVSRHRPIKGIAGVVKIILVGFAMVLSLAVILNRSPWLLLSGMGALTAVLLIVFKDTLLGFVAGMQLTVNNMVAIGDWIEMPKYGADGEVIDISLHTVKVQNWDKTITTIPSYALVSDSFKNWRGMTASGGRRIKRALLLDSTSFAFLKKDQLDRLEGMDLIGEYVRSRRQEIALHNEAHVQNKATEGNGRAMTNIGTFRAYIEAYLRAHPGIHQGMTLMVRHREPGPDGLPLEIYAFTSTSQWAQYEAIQADVFDHVMTIAPKFDLRLFQQPSGHDVAQLSSSAGSAGVKKNGNPQAGPVK
ncbi:MAG: mechanosensitive ion channel family protein [Myxococcota bacterium]|jgi:miniconductance mechanosensitive channel|nr:mechanosensitive ion channel family protein [Myxococcota bacterium]